MRAAIIAMAEPTKAGGAQALAIAEYLAGSGFEPWLICESDSPLAATPVSVPRLCLGSGKIGAAFRLWQWQRAARDMLVIAMGQPSLKLARRLAGLGKRGSRKLAAAFMLEPPQKDRNLEAADICICGSQFIARDVEGLLAGAKKRPELAVVLPGLDVEKYQCPTLAWQEGTRFVFGMGASLVPHSGVLLIVRAMSALWQHDELPPWEVRMFGAGPRFEEVMEEAANLGVLPRLAILAEQPLEEVCRYCHVWLVPGASEFELPAVTWSGYASGMPTIALASPLHEERQLIKPHVLCIKGPNPQEMARAMLNMMRNPGLCRKLGATGMEMRPEISLAGMSRRFFDCIKKISAI